MLIEPAPDLYDAMMAALRDEYMTDRLRPGLHMSQLIYCLSKTWWDHHDPEPPTDREVSLWSIGFAMERVMIHRMHLEPLVLDGIHMTPDFKLVEVADLKTTRKAPTVSNGCAVCGEPYRGHSASRMGHVYEPTSMPFQFPAGWKRQFMAYRHGLNQLTCKCGHSLGHHQHNGYRNPARKGAMRDCYGGLSKCDCKQFQPAAVVAFDVVVMHLIQAEVTTWRVYFTQQELEDNWSWILQRANDLENMNAAQDPMPYQHLGFEGECSNCRYQLKCGLYASLHGYSRPQLQLVSDVDMEEAE